MNDENFVPRKATIKHVSSAAEDVRRILQEAGFPTTARNEICQTIENWDLYSITPRQHGRSDGYCCPHCHKVS